MNDKVVRFLRPLHLLSSAQGNFTSIIPLEPVVV